MTNIRIQFWNYENYLELDNDFNSSHLLTSGYEWNSLVENKPSIRVPTIYKTRNDTACPLRLKNRQSSRIDKWPNVITIGFGKCGTGSLAFIDCHSDIVFRLVEPVAFANPDWSLNFIWNHIFVITSKTKNERSRPEKFLMLQKNIIQTLTQTWHYEHITFPAPR